MERAKTFRGLGTFLIFFSELHLIVADSANAEYQRDPSFTPNRWLELVLFFWNCWLHCVLIDNSLVLYCYYFYFNRSITLTLTD